MLRIGYSYDVTTSKLKNYSSGSHEIMLNYCFMIVKPDLNEIYHQRTVPLSDRNQQTRSLP
jgi:hypothetical protein